MADTTHAIIHATAPMPKEIAKAILGATEQITGALAGAEGERGSHTFKYANINDVLSACHEALKAVKLGVIPIEIEYKPLLENGVFRATYGYKFRLIHESGITWIDHEDIRHVTVIIEGDGMNSGKAQSLALRDFLKGLLRIKTVEPEDTKGEHSANVSRETGITRSSVEHPNGTMPIKIQRIMFSFHPGTADPYTLEAADKKFNEFIASARYATRKQWESDEVNVTGLRQLMELDKKMWFRWRKILDEKFVPRGHETQER